MSLQRQRIEIGAAQLATAGLDPTAAYDGAVAIHNAEAERHADGLAFMRKAAADAEAAGDFKTSMLAKAHQSLELRRHTDADGRYERPEIVR